jgi:hypothetical protein
MFKRCQHSLSFSACSALQNRVLLDGFLQTTFGGMRCLASAIACYQRTRKKQVEMTADIDFGKTV